MIVAGGGKKTAEYHVFICASGEPDLSTGTAALPLCGGSALRNPKQRYHPWPVSERGPEICRSQMEHSTDNGGLAVVCSCQDKLSDINMISQKHAENSRLEPACWPSGSVSNQRLCSKRTTQKNLGPFQALNLVTH